jgi:hypothetical protein
MSVNKCVVQLTQLTDTSKELDDVKDINSKLGDITVISKKMGDGKATSTKLGGGNKSKVVPGRLRGFKNQVMRTKQKQTNWLTVNKKRIIFLIELLLMIKMMLILPTWDVGSDV